MAVPRFATDRLFRTIFKQKKIYNCNFYSTKLSLKVGFIGDGAMAKAICKSIFSKGLIEYSQVYVASPYPKNLDAWKSLGANVSTDNSVVAKEAEIVFLAVKPHILKGALDAMATSPLAPQITNKLFVSILAGITTTDLEKMLAKFDGSRVVRVMPNTPMLVGKGCTVYCPGSTVTEDDLKLVHSILEVTGMCQCLPEHMINAIGAVSSSGPAFVYLFIEALSDGGVRMGLHRDMATRFAAQTVMGAAQMVLDTNKHMGTLKDDVCSAGGQTIAGIHALERGGVRGAVMDAVEAAALRAAELGQQRAAGAFWFLLIILAIYFCSKLRGYRRRIDEGYYFAEKLTFGHNGAMVTLTAIHPSNVDLSGEVPRVINPALTYD